MPIQKLPGAAIAPGTITVTQLDSSTSSVISTGGGPKITAVTVTNAGYNNLDDTAVDIAGGYIKITGTGFVTGCQILINNTPATSTTFVSATEVRAQVPATAAGSYIVYLVNPDGGVAIRINGITFSSTPAWVTDSALGGSVDEAISIQLVATGAISFALAQGSTLPTGLTLTSGGLLSGTITGLINDTSYSFTINAIDAENQDSPRSFTINITAVLQVPRSLKFNPGEAQHLTRTFGTPTNRKIFTFSVWVKRSEHGSTTNNYLIEGYVNDSFRDAFSIYQDRLTCGSSTLAVLRDLSAWYHFVISVDTTQASSALRTRVWINGQQDDIGGPIGSIWAQNYESSINGPYHHNIGRSSYGGGVAYHNGYMAEMYLIDGQALTSTSFGKIDTNTGQWVPKKYTGTYGINGFYLNFGDTSNLTANTLGKDSSGNNNNFTPNNFRLSQSSVYWSRYFTYGNGSGIVPNLRIFDGTTTNGGASVNGVTQNFVPPTPISYNSLEVLFGNGNNTGSAGAPLSLNGVVVQNAPAGSGGATSTYTTNIPGVLTTLSVGGAIGGQYESNIYKIKVDGRYLTDPIFSSSLIDSPTNYGIDTGTGSEVRGNYATLNPFALGSYASLSNGCLSITGTTSTNSGGSLSTIGVTTGKWYFEFTVTSTSASFGGVVTYYPNNPSLNDENNVFGASGSNKGIGIRGSGSTYGNAAEKQTIAAFTFNTVDIIGVAIDADNGAVYFRVNSTWLNSGNPTSGASRTGSFHNWVPAPDRVCHPALVAYNGQGATANFGQLPFAYAAPSGFKSLNTHNLPTPNVVKSNTAFDTVLYTGTGSALTVGGLSFSPDFVWYKSRSSSTYFHGLFDTVRGATKFLATNDSGAEVTDAARLSAFTANGFTVGTDVGVNTNGANMVAWAWDAGTASVVNTAGSISANVRVNTTAGISIVSYTGTQATATVGHGLGVAPKLIIAKSRSVSTTNWVVYHSSLGSTSSLLILNLANATTTITNYWGSAVPTSTVFGVANGVYDNNNGSMIAYCFAEVPGYSAFGSYTGNGSADGPFIYTGFRPALIIAKQTNTSGQNWYILDSGRSPSNVVNRRLYPNLVNGEDSDGNINCDLLSNGFKLRDAYTGWNASGGTYVYMAFAESPFKYARAR